MMNETYSNAIGVLAWLGPEADSSGEVMDEISKSGQIIVSGLSKMTYPTGVEDGMVAAAQMGSHKLALFMLRWIAQLTPLDETGRQSVPDFWQELGWDQCEQLPSEAAWTSFCVRPYWRRVWILQELANAKSAYILCGTRKIPLYRFLAILRFVLAISWIRFVNPVLRYMVLLRQTLELAPILRCLVVSFLGDTSKVQRDLLKLLVDCGTMGATIPQDRIFALSALATDDLRLNLSYTKSLLEYLEDIVRHRILRVGLQPAPLEISRCSWSSGSPSWVAHNFRGFGIDSLRSIFLSVFCLHYKDVVEDEKLLQDFHACAQTPSTFSQLNFPRPGILKVQCVPLGRVQRLQHLTTTDDEESRYQIVVRRAIDSNLLPDDAIALRTRAVHSSLLVVSILQKLISFLDGTSGRKLSDFGIPQDHDSENQLLVQILSLFIRPNKDATEHPGSQEFYRGYENAIQDGFRQTCSLSTMVLSLIGENDEKWRVFHESVNSASMFYVETMKGMCMKRSIFEFAGIEIGLGPDTVQGGDCVVIFPGFGVPYIVRPVGIDIYTIIGDAYIPGIMYGELFEQEEVITSKWMEFC